MFIVMSSPSPQIAAYYSIGSHTETALVVHDCSFSELLARAGDALRLPQDAIIVAYTDDEGETVSIASQAELDEALLQHDNRLVCRLNTRLCPPTSPPSSSFPKNVTMRQTASNGHFNKATLIVLFAVIPCLIAATVVLMSIPRTGTATAESCPDLIRLWSGAIESGTIGDDSAPTSSIYNLVDVCPRGRAHSFRLFLEYDYIREFLAKAISHFPTNLSSNLLPSLG